MSTNKSATSFMDSPLFPSDAPVSRPDNGLASGIDWESIVNNMLPAAVQARGSYDDPDKIRYVYDGGASCLQPRGWARVYSASGAMMSSGPRANDGHRREDFAAVRQHQHRLASVTLGLLDKLFPQSDADCGPAATEVVLKTASRIKTFVATNGDSTLYCAVVSSTGGGETTYSETHWD